MKNPPDLPAGFDVACALVSSAACTPSIPPSKEDDEAKNYEEHEQPVPKREGRSRQADAAQRVHWEDPSSGVKSAPMVLQVTAPSEADETSAAYLAITPRV